MWQKLIELSAFWLSLFTLSIRINSIERLNDRSDWFKWILYMICSICKAMNANCVFNINNLNWFVQRRSASGDDATELNWIDGEENKKKFFSSKIRIKIKTSKKCKIRNQFTQSVGDENCAQIFDCVWRSQKLNTKFVKMHAMRININPDTLNIMCIRWVYNQIMIWRGSLHLI